MEFYIDTAGDDAAGFTRSPSSSQTVTGFGFYESVAFWVTSNGDWKSLFYATPTSQAGVWTITWNSGRNNNGTPVALKQNAPGSLSTTTT
jgi:hypothetical protein